MSSISQFPKQKTTKTIQKESETESGEKRLESSSKSSHVFFLKKIKFNEILTKKNTEKDGNFWCGQPKTFRRPRRRKKTKKIKKNLARTEANENGDRKQTLIEIQ